MRPADRTPDSDPHERGGSGDAVPVTTGDGDGDGGGSEVRGPGTGDEGPADGDGDGGGSDVHVPPAIDDGRADDAATSASGSTVTVALTVALAVGAYGLGYGVLAVAAGLSPVLAVLSSVLVLAGGSQFAFVGVLAAGGNPLLGALSGLLLNARYLAFGLAIAQHLGRAPLPRRLVDSYLVTDESVALALAGPPRQVVRRFRVVGAAVVVAWIGSTAIGAYGGALLGDPETYGLDAAFPAGFLLLLSPWLRRPDGRIAALVGAAVALALTPVTPPGVPILAAGAGALVAMRRSPDRGDVAEGGPR